MYEVFISYRRSDGTELARTIKEILSSDYKVFFDHSSLRDGKWKIKLDQALSEAPVLLCLMTRDFFGEWGKPNDCIQEELNNAIDNNKVIIPIQVGSEKVHIPDSIPSRIKDAIEEIQYSLVHNDQSFDRDIQAVKNRLESIVKRCRNDRRRGENEIKRAINFLWGINGERRNLQMAYDIFNEVYQAIPYMTDALVGIGVCLKENGQQDAAITCFKKAGDKGNGEANYLIAQIYEQMGRSPIEFGRYYDRAAYLDYAPALVIKGKEAKDYNNTEEALFYFDKAAELGDSNGLYQSALIYNEKGMAQNRMDLLQKSIDLVYKAIDAGNAEAMNYLGILYYRGEIIERNTMKAFELVSKAADAGFVLAQYNKGCMLYDGIGIARNKKLGKEWLEYAKQNGSEDARRKLEELNKGVWNTITNLFG